MRPSDRPAATPLAERIASVSTRPQTAPGPEPADVERDWGYAYPTASSGVPVPTAGNAETVSIGCALRSVLGRFGTLLVAFFFLFASVGFLSERGPNGDDIAGVALLLVLVTFWLGGIVWAQRTAGWGWASGFFACWLIALPWLMVRRARAGTSEHARQFPAFWASGALTIIGAMLFVAGISNGGSGGTADASGNPTNGDRIAIAAPTELPEDSMQSDVTTGTGSASSEIALPSATVTATATVAATMTATPPPSPTIAPTDTPMPRPTKTATPKPTRTPKPKPTRTPKPKPTRTPRPSAAFDPDETAQTLHDASFTSDEYYGLYEPDITWSDDPTKGAVGEVEVVTELGTMWYIVFSSDREADRYLEGIQTGHEISMPDYPRYAVAIGSFRDGSAYYAASVGNVVILTITSDQYLIATGAYNPNYEAYITAGVQTEAGVKHLLRVEGEDPDDIGEDTF